MCLKSLTLYFYAQVCDGIPDCPKNYDESECPKDERKYCPGFLYCKQDNICVHQGDICDGIIHCRLSLDDEYDCHPQRCPGGCTCVGETVFCTENDTAIVTEKYTHLHGMFVANDQRYLDTFHNFPNLFYLEISNINFDEVAKNNQQFLSLSHLIILVLHNTTISRFTSHFFSGLHSLLSICIMDSSHIDVLYEFSFDGLTHVKTLNLSMLTITAIQKCAFCGMHSLEVLDLSFNQLLKIADGTLFVHQAIWINLTGNPFQWIHKYSVSSNAVVQFDNLMFCCFLSRKINCIPVINNSYDLCTRFIPRQTLEVIIVVLVLLIVLLNVATVVHIIHSQYRILYLVLNLVISDLCFAAYLIGIVVANWTYDRSHTLAMQTWINSKECHILSAIIFLSILNSKTSCVIIVVKYMLVTKYAFKKHLFNKGGQIILVFMIWLVSIALASLYLLSVDLQTPFCLPYQATHSINYLPVIVNSLYSSFLLICNFVIGYLYRQVYVCLKLSAKNLSLRNTSGQKVYFRALTSCVVYMTTTIGVLILSFEEQVGLHFDSSAQIVLLIFMSPDALLNPFIYTLSTKLYKLLKF